MPPKKGEGFNKQTFDCHENSSPHDIHRNGAVLCVRVQFNVVYSIHVHHSPDVCVEEEGGIFMKSFHECSILGEADFLMEAFIAWSLKRKYLWQELLVIVCTEQCSFPDNCILHRLSSHYAGLPRAC